MLKPMQAKSGIRPIADVRVSQHLDHLVITPRNRSENSLVAGALKKAVPDATFRRSAGGVSVFSEDPANLGEVSSIDLRWRPEAVRFAENRRRVRRAHDSIREEVRKLLASDRATAERYIHDVGDLDLLDDHQCTNVAAMTLPGGFGLCIFDEQGTGKTVTLIYAFDELVHRDEVDIALIIAPKSMIPEWPRDFAIFKGDLYTTAVVSGSKRQKRSAIASGADVLVTNFETAVAMEAELAALLRSHADRAMLVIDESFYVKNLDAQRTQAIRRLRELSARAFVLCGTPAPNSPHDLIQQFNIVDMGLTFDGIDIPEDRDEARSKVQSAINEKGIFVRHLKSEVLPGLPAKSFQLVSIPLQPNQYDLYQELSAELIRDLEETDEMSFRKQLTSFLARRSALLQICSNPSRIVADYREIPAKLLALDSLLEELILNRREKVVLWSFYTASLEAIIQRFGRFNPVRYDGSVTEISARREAVRRFQEDDHTMLFVGNPAAAGAGLTLHRSRFAIYESMSNQAAHYLQSLDRIHRRGQEREVQYIILLAENTLEEKEYQRLLQKQHAAHDLLGDPATEQPVSRQAMLSELLSDWRFPTVARGSDHEISCRT
jgi:SNF2 family DNA or RNA helicase